MAIHSVALRRHARTAVPRTICDGEILVQRSSLEPPSAVPAEVCLFVLVSIVTAWTLDTARVCCKERVGDPSSTAGKSPGPERLRFDASDREHFKAL